MSASTPYDTIRSSSPVPDRTPDVVDLKAERQVRRPSASVLPAAPCAGWVCPVCELSSTGFTPTEAAYLARVHDQLLHGSSPTAHVQLDVRTAPAAEESRPTTA